MKKKRLFKGFTLIELIIVIAVIALLAAATFVAINPAKRVGDANNARRWSDVTAIADAYGAYLADNSGVHPTTTPEPTAGITYAIATTTGGSGTPTCTASSTMSTFVALDSLVTNGYVGAIPLDPTYVSGDAYNTGYYFYRESTGKMIVGACDTYNSQVIKVVR